jgi:hypothetical protein
MGYTFRHLAEVRMPWKESSVMDERLRFVARLLDGEGMSDVCREFGISHKTGYKIYTRYKDSGLEGLCDRSHRPVSTVRNFVYGRAVEHLRRHGFDESFAEDDGELGLCH